MPPLRRTRLWQVEGQGHLQPGDICLYDPLPLIGLLPSPPPAATAPPLPPPPSPCCRRRPLSPSSSSFSLVILTLNIAGCLCSAFEFILHVALDDWILTASVFCLVSGFLNTASTVMLKFSMSPCSFGYLYLRQLLLQFTPRNMVHPIPYYRVAVREYDC